MSSHSPLLTLSPQTCRDLRGIANYSRKNWGDVKANEYYQRLLDGLKKIQNIPTIGARSQDVSPQYRVYKVQKHRIIYRLTDEEIRIMRVLHDERIVPRYLT